jgi:hypothetical protein
LEVMATKNRSVKKSEDSLGPELASIMKDDAVRWFDRLRSARTALAQSVQSLSLTSSRSVKDALIFAYFRKVLDLVELPLKQGTGGAGVDIFNNWANRSVEFRRLCTTGSEIASYLLPSGSKADIAQEAKKEIAGLLPAELVFVSVPVLDTFFAVRGAPVKMRSIAVRALQMKIEKNWTLSRITREVCPCGKPSHGEKCKQVVRQSMISLKKLLVRCGIELPAPKAYRYRRVIKLC